MWFLLFVKQLPIMAISEIKEIVPPKRRPPPAHSPGAARPALGTAGGEGGDD
jgi:hypothetical protein